MSVSNSSELFQNTFILVGKFEQNVPWRKAHKAMKIKDIRHDTHIRSMVWYSLNVKKDRCDNSSDWHARGIYGVFAFSTTSYSGTLISQACCRQHFTLFSVRVLLPKHEHGLQIRSIYLQ